MTDFWILIATSLGSAAALVGVPLTAIVSYLKAIREDQREFRASLLDRIGQIETECDRIETAVDHVERQYTTREDWTRETILARNQLTRLTELMARLQAEMETSRALATQFARATQAIIGLTERLCTRLPPFDRTNGLDAAPPEVAAERHAANQSSLDQPIA